MCGTLVVFGRPSCGRREVSDLSCPCLMQCACVSVVGVCALQVLYVQIVVDCVAVELNRGPSPCPANRACLVYIVQCLC